MCGREERGRGLLRTFLFNFFNYLCYRVYVRAMVLLLFFFHRLSRVYVYSSHRVVSRVVYEGVIYPPYLNSRVRHIGLMMLQPLSRPYLREDSRVATTSNSRGLLFSPTLFAFFYIFYGNFLFYTTLHYFTFIYFYLFFLFIRFTNSAFGRTIIRRRKSGYTGGAFRVRP